MTQRQYEPSTTAVESLPDLSVQDSKILENRVRGLSDRIEQQAQDLREIQRVVRRLQNEVRAAVTAFNLKHHG